MSIHYARYELVNGFIHNWIVAGPQAIHVLDLERFHGDDWKLQIAREYESRYMVIASGAKQSPSRDMEIALAQSARLAMTPESVVTQTPVETETFQVGDAQLTW